MARARQTAWQRHCPVCEAGEIGLGIFDSSRKRVRRCPQCGVRVEFIVPAWPYYSLATFFFLLWSIVPFLWIYLALAGRWQWGAAAALAALFLMAGANFIFSPMLVARRADEIPPDEIDYHRKFGG